MPNLLPEPVFIVGGARSGTSLLFDILSASPDLWSAYRELHGPYEWELGLKPDVVRGESNALDASHATPERIAKLRTRLHRALSNGERLGFPSDRLPAASLYMRRVLRVLHGVARTPTRMVDKNPKHCFRVPFLRAVFPDARFVFLCRGPRGSIQSLLEGWSAKAYATYDMRGTQASVEKWSFDLPPGWPAWASGSVEQLCAHQWVGYYESMLQAVGDLAPGSYIACRYEDLIARPHDEISRIFRFLDLPLRGPAERLARAPRVVNAVTKPSKDKWRGRSEVLAELSPIFDAMRVRLGYDERDQPLASSWL